MPVGESLQAAAISLHRSRLDNPAVLGLFFFAEPANYRNVPLIKGTIM